MKRRPVVIFLLLGAVAPQLLSAHARAELLAVGGDGLFRIDERSAQVTLIAPIKGYSFGTIAMHPSGSVYFPVWHIAAEREYLATLDRDTGTVNRGPVLSLPFPDGFAVSGDGELFATGYDRLYAIDVNTGIATLVGSTGFIRIVALAFGADGTLYGWDMGDFSGKGGAGLVTIDLATGVGLDIDPTVNAPEGVPTPVAALAFAPDGTLYGANENLYRLDVDSGALSLVGPIEGLRWHVTGMVWVPEPSTLTAVVMFAVALFLAQFCRLVVRST